MLHIVIAQGNSDCQTGTEDCTIGMEEKRKISQLANPSVSDLQLL
jgi:hypothetical protein